MSMYSFGNGLYSGERSFKIVGRRKLWFTIALVAVAISCLAFIIRTPNLGIEFRGGSQFTISGTSITEHQPAYDVVATVSDNVPRVSTVGEHAVRVQTEQLDDQQTQQVRDGLADSYQVPESEVTSTYVGPSWGHDILVQALRAVLIFMVAISLILTIYFRSWMVAVAALGALLHDFIVTLGIYWILGLEVTPATVIGLLTIMGYSLYDTVVVFDKVRENTTALTNQVETTYAERANLAINQTLIRSMNTSLTGLLPVLAVLVVGVWLLGADTLRDLALVMFVGMALSALSSIFVAAPLAVTLSERSGKIREHTEKVKRLRAEAGKENDSSGVLPTLHAGGHLGQAAQPKRKSKKKRKH